MTEILRTRDCVVLFRGDAYNASLSSSLTTSGWAGGQGVMWTDSTKDEFLVTRSDGLYGGFLLWGSNESSDQFVSFFKNQIDVSSGVICLGGWMLCTSSYEKYTYASRQSGPLVSISYQEGLRLRFSLRGLFTTEDEWALSGDPRGSNQFYLGNVTQAPKASNNYYLGVQTSI